jgi:uncharacterized protein (UPF0297 family)
MKNINLTLLLLITGLIAGCGPRVETKIMTDKNLSNYDSFAYLPNTDIEFQGKSLKSNDVNEAVVETVYQNLRKRGYKMDRSSPDLLVLISTYTNPMVGTRTEPMYAYYPYSTSISTVSPFYDTYYYRGFADYNSIVGYDIDTYAYKEGIVVINIVDRKTKETVWKGVAAESIYDQTSIDAIEELVNAVFNEFPER